MTKTNKAKMLVLSLTGACNFACRYCYAAEHNKTMMKLETALKALELIDKKEKFVLQFSGGEPLLNFKCLQQTVNYVNEHNLPALLQIQTNASLINEEIAKFLKNNKIAVGVSLDGMPAVNDKMRILPDRRGTTDLILNGLEILKRNNIAVGITCVVTDENVDTLPDFIDFAYFIGNIRKIGFDILRTQGRGIDIKSADAATMRENIKKVYERAYQLSLLTGYEINFSQKQCVKLLEKNKTAGFSHCYAMTGEAAFVDAIGDIYACSSLVGSEEFYIGNVNNGVNADSVARISQKIKKTMNVCCRCDSFALCGGGCFSRWYGQSNMQLNLTECALKKESIASYQHRYE